MKNPKLLNLYIIWDFTLKIKKKKNVCSNITGIYKMYK